MALIPPPQRIPTPQEAGLPEKFDKWRSGQEDFLNVIITTKKRIVAGCAPTGSGKSPVCVAAARYSGRPTCIVTATKGLQKQYMDDFGCIGMVSLMGRANYPCNLRPEMFPLYSCEDGGAARCMYHGTVQCLSSQAEMAAASSPLVVTNYAKWTSSRRFGTGMQHFTQVIFDEGDEGPDAIANAMRVVLNSKEVEEGLKLNFPSHHEAEEMQIWKTWARNAAVIAEGAMQAAQARIAGLTDPKPAWVRHFTHMRNLWRRLAIIRTAKPEDWIVEEVEGGYQFDPIRIGRYAESTLLLGVEHIVFVSATLIPKTMFLMGIARTEFDFKEFPSDFPPERCPIYYVPTMRVDMRADSFAQLWLKHDQIAAKRRDRNGVAHTVSYPRQAELVSQSRFGSSMVTNKRGEPVSDAIDRFFGIYPGAILASPSVEAGYDFAFKKCEWQFMCKIPFDPPSKILKAREADDREYRGYNAARRFVQAVGRGMRERTDQCEFFIGDEHLDWFLPKFGHLFPARFKLGTSQSLIQRVGIVPPPPPRLI